ncbi:MAG: hypothetical protein ACRDTC_22890 [Pseudonocardiaceae bacterium]
MSGVEGARVELTEVPVEGGAKGTGEMPFAVTVARKRPRPEATPGDGAP